MKNLILLFMLLLAQLARADTLTIEPIRNQIDSFLVLCGTLDGVVYENDSVDLPSLTRQVNSLFDDIKTTHASLSNFLLDNSYLSDDDVVLVTEELKLFSQAVISYRNYHALLSFYNEKNLSMRQ